MTISAYEPVVIMDNRVDLICQHTMEGNIIPLKIRLRDEDGELQEFAVKGYRDKSEHSLMSFECVIIVRDVKKIIDLFSMDSKVWHWREIRY